MAKVFLLAELVVLMVVPVYLAEAVKELLREPLANPRLRFTLAVAQVALDRALVLVALEAAETAGRDISLPTLVLEQQTPGVEAAADSKGITRRIKTLTLQPVALVVAELLYSVGTTPSLSNFNSTKQQN